jgi:hypothetical protein
MSYPCLNICVLALWFALINTGQTATSDMTAAEREKQGQALAADLRKPQEGLSTGGILVTRDSLNFRVRMPVKMQVILGATNWQTIYEASIPGQAAVERLTIIHDEGQPNKYVLAHVLANGSMVDSATLTGAQATVPFANSDFWLADLGLEFFYWSKQSLFKKEMRQGRACRVLESTNPNPTDTGYTRVLSWIDNETGRLFLAEAFGPNGKRLKTFRPSEFKKVNGHWQVKELEIRTALPKDSLTKLQLDLEVH